MDVVTEKITRKYVNQYAKRDDGSMDEDLANRIRYEITRRSEMDVFEPGRWAIYSSILGVLSGGAAKVLHDRAIANKEVNKSVVKSALIGTAFGSFAAALLMEGRILSFARYKAGLYAGAQIAITQHHLQQKMLGIREEVALAKETAPITGETREENWKEKVFQQQNPSPSLVR